MTGFSLQSETPNSNTEIEFLEIFSLHRHILCVCYYYVR
jgi:hypothetical protein